VEEHDKIIEKIETDKKKLAKAKNFKEAKIQKDLMDMKIEK